MPDTIITTDRYMRDPEARQLLEHLNDNATALGLDSAVFYYDFPSYSDYESVVHKPDVLVLSPNHGVVAIRFANQRNLFGNGDEDINDIDMSLDEFSSLLFARLLKSQKLKRDRRTLKFDVTPLLLGVEFGPDEEPGELLCDFAPSYARLEELINNSQQAVPLDDDEFSECRSVIEGAKAIARPQKRNIADPENHKLALALSELETEIANFDRYQRQTALSLVQGPQRIRGLAGSGKTIILAMKAAHIHLTHPEAHILVTFFTKSLQPLFRSLISRFYRHYKDEDPDWDFIDVLHGWGGRRKPGVYYDASRRLGMVPMSFGDAKTRSRDPFDFVCKQLANTQKVEPYYDYILIDEGQDFPSGFYELAFYLAKGDRDRKNIIWAYDELQNILNVSIRSAAELFGVDEDREPRIDLERAHRLLPTGASNDIVLNKCYRNQREVLVTAHALGFGLYGPQIVQLLQDEEHWRDVGYEIQDNALKIGSEVVLTRPEENNPTSLDECDGAPIIKTVVADDLEEEVDWIVSEIELFIQGGLKPEDIMIVALDDRNARAYFKFISSALADNGVETNNIIADPYSEPPFTLENMITLSTVYRAKGNEAAVVFACGIDAIVGGARAGRNKIFTAFTRSKGWLRVSGIGDDAESFDQEINRALELCPQLKFIMPDPDEIETIQRDFSERAIKAQRIRRKYLDDLRKLGYSEDEIADMLAEEGKDE